VLAQQPCGQLKSHQIYEDKTAPNKGKRKPGEKENKSSNAINLVNLQR
jgi:hypothetical protein